MKELYKKVKGIFGMQLTKKVNDEDLNKSWFFAGFTAIVCAVALPFIIIAVTKTNFKISEIGKLGSTGDFFGGSTIGFFSLASIFFVIHAISIQSKELELQRKELELTRKEFQDGNATAKIQQIDNAFFNMLTLHNEIVNNLVFTEGHNYYGRGAIAELKDIFEQQYIEKYHEDVIRDGYELMSKNALKIRGFAQENFVTQSGLDEVYKDFHENYGDVIGHYMRNNYRIVKFIVENVANDEEEKVLIEKKSGRTPIIADKKYYFGMLRAQWSNSEFELILINSLYKENHKFKSLILEHDVLDVKDEKLSKERFVLKKSMNKFNAYRHLI